MPARHSSYLHPNQLVKVIHRKSKQTYCLCEVKNLNASLALRGFDINDFQLEPLDAQGNPVSISKALAVEPFRWLKRFHFGQ